MTVVYALLCAGLWGGMELIFLRLAKELGGLALMAWLALGGSVLAAPLALLSGPPPGGVRALGAATAASLVSVAATGLYFVALERGTLSVISPVITAQAAVAVLLGVVVLDEHLSTLAAIGCVGAVIGVILAAAGTGVVAGGGGAGIAAVSAVLFGVYLILLAATAEAAGTFWTVLTYRVVAAAIIVPWLVRRERLPRPPWRLLTFALLLETAGFAAYVEAFARGPVAIAAPLTIQYSTIAVVLAALVLHERLRPHQWVGVALVIGAVSLVAAN